MSDTLSLLSAQIDTTVGAIEQNKQQIVEIIKKYQANHDLIVFPELCLCGYPAEDLLLRPTFIQATEKALNEIIPVVKSSYVIIGFPRMVDGKLYNSAALLHDGKCVAFYDKQRLPNYGVFDEQRYFHPGTHPALQWTIKGHHFTLAICEDIWDDRVITPDIAKTTDHLICINASPFHLNKQAQRYELGHRYAQLGMNLIYTNLVGGQDELIFDGCSFIWDSHNQLVCQQPAFATCCDSIVLQKKSAKGLISELPEGDALLYQALCSGLAAYVNKNKFPGVVLGLSGGIDSALTLAIAADALGPERVIAVSMPSRYTATISNEDAHQQIMAMGVNHQVFDIEPTFKALLSTMMPAMKPNILDIAKENCQARIRCVMLMALSNQTGHMLLSTSNKSESAVGYTTIYGDMSGGFAILKDVLKTEVYRLASYRNQISPVIPERVISRPPSAELAPNQYDQLSLPEYDILDGIIRLYMEGLKDTDEIIASGYNANTVHRVIGMIRNNEYKRRQAPPGIKVSQRAFDRDWRYPLTNGFY
ncbi:NAD+ synthase [Legionella sp. W05-934-2]|uniref:NAD+ synthase n=1 Tax=Legionella sp. W05-934-2 TaxID=1198649 RepID=UPI003461C4F7